MKENKTKELSYISREEGLISYLAEIGKIVEPSSDKLKVILPMLVTNPSVARYNILNTMFTYGWDKKRIVFAISFFVILAGVGIAYKGLNSKMSNDYAAVSEERHISSAGDGEWDIVTSDSEIINDFDNIINENEL